MLDRKLQNSDFQNQDLYQMLTKCLRTADAMSVPMTALKICEAIEFLENEIVQKEES